MLLAKVCRSQTVPVAVKTEAIHSTARTEGQRITCLIHDASKRIGSWDTCESVLRAVTAMH